MEVIYKREKITEGKPKAPVKENKSPNSNVVGW